MHINELPDIVLTRIFDWTCNINNNKSNSRHHSLQWRTKAKLLVVCRMWRELAFSSVYKVSFIQCISIGQYRCEDTDINSTYFSSEDSDDSRYYSDASSISAKSWNSFTCDRSIGEKIIVRSNLDILGRHRKYWPKYLHILIKTRREPACILRRLIQEVGHYSNFLSAIERAELTFSLSDVEPAPFNGYSNMYGIDKIGEEFTQLVPSVKHLKLRGCSDNNAILTFARSVIKGYAHQLTGFVYPQIALKKVNAFSDKLTHAIITREGGLADYMPQICAEYLTVLDLKFIKDDFDWSSFGSRDSSRCLHFANLKWLGLKPKIDQDYFGYDLFTWEYPIHEFGYKVMAPKLEHVVIHLCPATLRFLVAIQDAVTINHVDIELGATHMIFTDFRIGLAREKLVSYVKLSMGESQYISMYSFMNDIFSVPNLAEYAKAILCEQYLLLNIDQVSWNCLADIEIFCPVHINDLQRLTYNLPDLKKMHIDKLLIETQGKIAPEILDKKASVAPISCKLNTFSFVLNSDYSEEGVDSVRRYLSKLFPSCIVEGNTHGP